MNILSPSMGLVFSFSKPVWVLLGKSSVCWLFSLMEKNLGLILMTLPRVTSGSLKGATVRLGRPSHTAWATPGSTGVSASFWRGWEEILSLQGIMWDSVSRMKPKMCSSSPSLSCLLSLRLLFRSLPLSAGRSEIGQMGYEFFKGKHRLNIAQCEISIKSIHKCILIQTDAQIWLQMYIRLLHLMDIIWFFF